MDYMISKSNAEHLAHRLRQYWKHRLPGVTIITKEEESSVGPIWVVRSNIVECLGPLFKAKGKFHA